MNISFDPKNSMKKFHNDVSINKLVDICFDNKNNQIFYDIVDLIFLRDYKSVKLTLKLLQKEYEMKDMIDIFDEYEKCFDEIYKKPTVDNLRGAFLEVLSYRIFDSEFDYNICSMDCNVVIDNWTSKSVDVGMICDKNGLVCESKISEINFTEKIFRNLLNIKYYSKGFFTLSIITLANKSAINDKIDEISNKFNGIYDLDQIHIFTRNDLANFSITN